MWMNRIYNHQTSAVSPLKLFVVVTWPSQSSQSCQLEIQPGQKLSLKCSTERSRMCFEPLVCSVLLTRWRKSEAAVCHFRFKLVFVFLLDTLDKLCWKMSILHNKFSAFLYLKIYRIDQQMTCRKFMLTVASYVRLIVLNTAWLQRKTVTTWIELN